MGVPCSDERDFRFAKQYGLPIIHIFEGTEHLENPSQQPTGILCNSDFLNGKTSEAALEFLYSEVEKRGIGKKKINYRMRDAIFARQRYWGEPIPIYYKDGVPYPLDEKELPLVLPEIDKYLPTETGEPPLARAKNWTTKEGYPLETNTMPGWAGSSWYFLRYMSPHENQCFVNPDAEKYWNTVDLYVGGTEHAVGHLLYARFWNAVLYDLGYVSSPEPFKKLVNQGMIQGRSSIVYRINGTNTFVSKNLIQNYEVTPIRVDVNFVENDVLDIEKFRQWRAEYQTAEFILEEGKYICGSEIEKMSKRWHNVVNPDDMCDKYGADTFRMYEMFLGPIEQHKPWNTAGITGVHGFLKKLYNLFFNDKEEWIVNEDTPNQQELKVLHQTIKKIEEDCEKLSFNTAVAQFMICVNELTKLKCHKKAILKDLLILLSPFAPHICEELWEKLGYTESITKASFPVLNPEYLIEESFEYPISINGKVKSKIEIPLNWDTKATEDFVLKNEKIINLIGGNTVKKVIVVHGKIVNIVI
jgi:leucyl-tRNA synthetase